MQFLKYNRPVAAIALAVIIILSVFLGVNRSVSSLGKAVQTAYTETEVASDLTKFASHAQQFAAIYTAHYGENGALAEAIDALRASLTSPIGETERITAVYSPVSDMYYKLSLDSSADETAKRSAKAYYYEMQSTLMRLSNNTEYAAAAKKYNDAIRTLPASVLARGRAEAVRFD